MLLYYKTQIELMQVSQSQLISLSSYVTHGKYRYWLFNYPTNLVLLASKVSMDKTLFKGIQG